MFANSVYFSGMAFEALARVHEMCYSYNTYSTNSNTSTNTSSRASTEAAPASGALLW